MPFTQRNGGAPGIEFHAATKALELEHSALSHQSVPPGARFPFGHTHHTQEEVDVVVRGSVRVPPGTWRGFEAGPEGLEILVAGAPNLGDDPRGDVDGERDWW